MSGSNRRSLNREELEIHQALSPASGSQQQPEQQTEVPSASNETTLTVDQLAMLIKSATAIGVKEGLAKSSPNRENVRKRQRSNSPAASIGAKSVDSDLPTHGLGVAQEETVTLKEVFGPNVNADNPVTDLEESDESDENLDNNNNFPNRMTPHDSKKVMTSIGIGTNSDELGEPDADLPSNNPRLPASWNPKKKIMSWVGGAIEHEWSAEDRKSLKEKFHPTEDYDHLFNPVKMPKKLFKSLKALSTKKNDYLLNRGEIEKDLYYASDDLCTSTRPLIEALSLLDDIPNCKEVKHLIGQGLQGIFSANKRISKGRREVGRRFVRLDCADALFSSSPSHRSLFGSLSDAEAVKLAKETVKLDDSIVYAPKKKFRFTDNKGFQRYSNQPWKKFQKQNYQYQSNNFQNNNNSNYSNNNQNNQKRKRWNQNQNQNGKGRGKGTQKNSSNQKD